VTSLRLGFGYQIYIVPRWIRKVIVAWIHPSSYWRYSRVQGLVSYKTHFINIVIKIKGVGCVPGMGDQATEVAL